MVKGAKVWLFPYRRKTLKATKGPAKSPAGTAMKCNLKKEDDRANLIAYLAAAGER